MRWNTGGSATEREIVVFDHGEHFPNMLARYLIDCSLPAAEYRYREDAQLVGLGMQT